MTGSPRGQVMYWADHGWALGEQSMFCKMANFELQTRVPIGAPQAGGSTGVSDPLSIFLPHSIRF